MLAVHNLGLHVFNGNWQRRIPNAEIVHNGFHRPRAYILLCAGLVKCVHAQLITHDPDSQ